MGQFEDAAHHYRRRLELRDEDALNAHVDLGIIARHEGNRAEARDHFEAALEVWHVAWARKIQSRAGLLENKALALLGRGRTEAACETIKQALDARLPGDDIDFVRYDLLAAAPEPPEGLEEVRRLLEEAADAAGCDG